MGVTIWGAGWAPKRGDSQPGNDYQDLPAGAGRAAGVSGFSWGIRREEAARETELGGSTRGGFRFFYLFLFIAGGRRLDRIGCPFDGLVCAGSRWVPLVLLIG